MDTNSSISMVRVESSAMSAANGHVQAIIAHCEEDLPLFLSERARTRRVIRDVLVLVAFSVVASRSSNGELRMAKTKISSTDLIWIYREKLSSFDDCSPSISIAIVPSSEGWTAVTTHRDRTGQPNCVRRIQQLQKQLREIYALAKD